MDQLQIIESPKSTPRPLPVVEPDWCIFCGLTLPEDETGCFCGPECEHHYFEKHDG